MNSCIFTTLMSYKQIFRIWKCEIKRYQFLFICFFILDIIKFAFFIVDLF